MVAPATLILQSHRQPLPDGWLEPCLASVRAWASHHGFAYRFEDDALFRHLGEDLKRATRERPVVAADLARLAAMEAALAEGYEAVVWLDADTLVANRQALVLPEASYAVGREVWVQPYKGRLRAFVKVHNAFLMARAGNPFLPFYRHAAENVVLAHDGPMVPQLVGPKLLSALHNLTGLTVAEHAGMLSPAVIRDLLAGGGEALQLFRRQSAVPPAAVNLCGSLVGRELDAADMEAVIDVLARGFPPP